MQNRSGRLILNSIYSVLGWLLPIALGLLVTPFILRRLGVEAYGLYLVILGFIGYSFTFNVGRVVAKFVAEDRASGGVDRINSAISAAFWISLGVGVVGAVVVLISAGYVVRDVLQVSPAYQQTATVALVIGGFSIPLTLVGQIFQSILQGTHRFGALSVITNLNWALLNAGNCALIYLGYGIDSLFVWTLLVAGLVAATSFFSAKRYHPEYRIVRGSAKAMLLPVSDYGASILLYQLFGSVMLLVERAWVTRHFGAESAAYYLVPLGLAIYFNGFMSSLTAATFPMLNELIADRQKCTEVYQKTTKVIVSLTVLFLVLVWTCGNSFLGLWIDPQFAEYSHRLFLIHSLTFGSIVLVIAIWQLNEAFNAARFNALIAGVWAIVTIVLMIGFLGRWSAEWAAMSRFIGVAITLPAIFFVENRFLGSVQGRFWLALLVRVGTAAAVLTFAEWLLVSGPRVGWIRLILSGIVGVAAYFATLAATGFFSRDEIAAVLRTVGLKRTELQ